MTSGIDWSTAVAVEQRDGRLWAPIPPQLAEQLNIGVGDVLCYTAFDSGIVEVWSVRRNPYQTLEIPADRP